MAFSGSGRLGPTLEALAIPVGALLGSMILFGLFVAVLGKNPLEVYALMYQGAFGSGFACAGSSNTAPAKFTTPNGAFTIANAAGGVRPYNSGTDSFNFGPFNYFQAPDERWNVNAFAHYDVHPRAI